MKKVVLIGLMAMMISCSSSHFYYSTQIADKKGILVLDKSTVDLLAWEGTNRNLDYMKVGNRIYVNLANIRPWYLSEWLKVNNQHVVFKESYEGILLHHQIEKPSEIGVLIESVTYEQLEQELALYGSELKDSFERYVELRLNANNDLTIHPSSYFTKGDRFYYSMAFFMAVGNANSTDAKTTFTFYKSKNEEKKDIIVIEVDHDGRKSYYDFAQYPPLQ